MAAIVTSLFRKDHAAWFASNSNLYVGLGKSDPWNSSDTPPLPTTSDLNILDVKKNLIGLKRAEGVTRVIPRVNLTAGRVYKAWNSSDHSCFYPTGTTYQCYALDATTFRLYMCVVSPGTAVTDVSFPSTLTTYDAPYVATDGYSWVYLGTVSEDSPFNSTQFVELPANPVDPSAAEAATGGILLYAQLISGGSGYTAGTYDIVGDGTLASVSVSAPSGTITGITVANAGSGYSYGGLGELYGSGADFKLVFAPTRGFGADLTLDLPSWFVGVKCDISGGTDTDIPTIPFRQLSVIDMTGTDFTSDSQYGLSTLPQIVMTEDMTIWGLTRGNVIEGNTSKARAFVDKVSTDTISFHQNSSPRVNFGTFEVGETLSVIAPDGSISALGVATVDSVTAPEYNLEGTVVFIENFKPKSRSLSQTEEIRIIIQM